MTTLDSEAGLILHSESIHQHIAEQISERELHEKSFTAQ